MLSGITDYFFDITNDPFRITGIIPSDLLIPAPPGHLPFSKASCITFYKLHRFLPGSLPVEKVKEFFYILHCSVH